MLPRARPLPVGDRALTIASAVLAFAAVVAGALHLSFHGSRRERLLKGAALAVLLLAIGLRLGWLGKPLSHEIPWLHDENAALAEARATGKPILVDFFAEWCAACKELDTHTYSDPLVRQEMVDRFVPLKVDATDETAEVSRLEQKYGIVGLPTVLLFACNE